MNETAEVRAAIVGLSDATPGTDAGVRAAARVAVSTGAPLHVLHALDIVGQPLPVAVRTLAELKNTIELTDSALREQLQRCAPSGASARRVIAHHGMTEAALRHTREHRVNMIACAPGMLSDPSARVADGAASLAELLRCPALIARRPLRAGSGRVLVSLGTTGMDAVNVAEMVDCIIALHASADVMNDERPPLAVELSFTVLDPRECATQERTREHTAQWTRALAARGHAAPRWSVAWSERPGRHLKRRAADPDLDLLVLHRSRMDCLAHYEVCDSVHASALQVASCPVLLYPTRVRAPLTLHAPAPEPDEIDGPGDEMLPHPGVLAATR